jgi:hypothetical protein
VGTTTNKRRARHYRMIIGGRRACSTPASAKVTDYAQKLTDDSRCANA